MRLERKKRREKTHRNAVTDNTKVAERIDKKTAAMSKTRTEELTHPVIRSEHFTKRDVGPHGAPPFIGCVTIVRICSTVPEQELQ